MSFGINPIVLSLKLVFAGSLFLAVISLGCSRNTYEMMSESMSPTLNPGDKVQVDTRYFTSNEPERFDVVAFIPPRYADQVWVMRIVGMPGEIIEFFDDHIEVNGTRLILPDTINYQREVDKSSYNQLAFYVRSEGFRVPEESYFFLGDNMAQANDSRFVGPIRRQNIIGLVIFE